MLSQIPVFSEHLEKVGAWCSCWVGFMLRLDQMVEVSESLRFSDAFRWSKLRKGRFSYPCVPSSGTVGFVSRITDEDRQSLPFWPARDIWRGVRRRGLGSLLLGKMSGHRPRPERKCSRQCSCAGSSLGTPGVPGEVCVHREEAISAAVASGHMQAEQSLCTRGGGQEDPL